jgi:four helix bundle protein
LLNIAEGTDRLSDTDFSKYLNISLTSLNEVISCLDIALNDEYITENEHKLYLTRGKDIYNQLKALTSKIRKDGKNKGSLRKIKR